MRIKSGVNDQYIYFVALAASDLKTRLTGLNTSNFTVVYSKNGAADQPFNSESVVQVDSITMPGVYGLLLNESDAVTLVDGDETDEVCLHITHSGGSMAPVSLTYEIYAPFVLPELTLVMDSENLSDISTAVGEGAVIQAIKAKTDKLDFTTVSGIVTGTPAANQFNGDATLSASNSFYVNSAVVFTSGALKGLARKVTAYTGSTKLIAVSPSFPTAPAVDDTFIFVGIVI